MPVETVLVIGTHGKSAEEIASVLRSEGYEVLTAPDIASAEVMAEKHIPSLVFLHDTDDGEALSFRGLSRQDPLRGAVPVIVVSSSGKSPDRSFTPSGVMDFLDLPFSPAELVEKTLSAFSLDFLGPESGSPAAQDAEEQCEYDRINASVHTYTTAHYRPGKVYTVRKDMRMRKRKRRLIAVALFFASVLIAAGFLSYRALQGSAGGLFSYASHAGIRGETVSVQDDHKTMATVGEQTAASGEKPIGSRLPDSRTVPGPLASAPKPAPVYSVQVGAFKKSSRAEKVAGQYREKGYDAFTEEGLSKGNETVYRVLVGRFNDQQASWKFGRAVSNEEKITVTIFNLNR